MHRYRFGPIVHIALLLCPLSVLAQWQPDGVPVCTATRHQESPQIVSDGSDGTIIVWEDARVGAPEIYAQRLNAAGSPLWAADGVPLRPQDQPQRSPVAVADGFGGAIVAWLDDRNGFSERDVYAQRVDSNGSPMWGANGVALCTIAGEQNDLAIVADGSGGAIVAWQHWVDPNGPTFAQRVDANGIIQWAVNGIIITPESGEGSLIVSDDAGGLIITWNDNFTFHVHAQRYNASGAGQWGVDGVIVYGGPSGARGIVGDDAGGAIVVFVAGTKLWASRINENGAPVWSGVFREVGPSPGDGPVLSADGIGGVLAAWVSYTEADTLHSNPDIFAQRVDGAGVKRWPDHLPVVMVPGYQNSVALCPDGAGGALFAWEDDRNGADDIYAQQIGSTGTATWAPGGIPICSAPNDQEAPAIVTTGVGSAVVAWHDLRTNTYRDIYAQAITSPTTAVAISAFEAKAHDGTVTLESAFRSSLGVTAVNVYRASDQRDFERIAFVDGVAGDRFSYVDRTVTAGRYQYQIGVVDADGEFLSPIATVHVGEIAAQLDQNAPNPFNPVTTIRFTLPSHEHVSLSIYDASGRLVRTLVDEVLERGRHETVWDGRKSEGSPVSSGVYFCRLSTRGFSEVRKMVLLK